MCPSSERAHTSANPGHPVYTTNLISRRWLSEKTFEITLTRPKKFQFRAGQTLCVHHQEIERHYSLVSAPEEARIVLCVRHVPNGLFSPILAVAEPGMQFWFSGPHGYFTYHPSSRPAIFVASGTGIAPFVPMVRSGAFDVCLLHGVRAVQELYYDEIFHHSVRQYIPCLSGNDSIASPPNNAFLGRVTEYIEQVLDPGVYDFYLCGNQKMIQDVNHLVDERFPGSYIFTEIFF